MNKPSPTTVVGSNYVRRVLNLSPSQLSRAIAAGEIEPIGQLSDAANGAYIFDRETIDRLAVASKAVARTCTCPEFDDSSDGPNDHADSCRTCSVHGTAVKS